MDQAFHIFVPGDKVRFTVGPKSYLGVVLGHYSNPEHYDPINNSIFMEWTYVRADFYKGYSGDYNPVGKVCVFVLRAKKLTPDGDYLNSYAGSIGRFSFIACVRDYTCSTTIKN